MITRLELPALAVLVEAVQAHNKVILRLLELPIQVVVAAVQVVNQVQRAQVGQALSSFVILEQHKKEQAEQ